MKQLTLVGLALAGCLTLSQVANAQLANHASPRAVVERFYAAFTTLKTAELAKLYATNVQFQDAIFQYADRAGTMNMWTKLMGAKPAPVFRYVVSSVSGDTVRGRWVADYIFFGNKVHNEIESTMVVRNGQIVRHTDAFPLHRWAAQAFGIKGTRLEWVASNQHFQRAIIAGLRLAINGVRFPTLCDVVGKVEWLARVFAGTCKR